MTPVSKSKPVGKFGFGINLIKSNSGVGGKQASGSVSARG